MPKLTPEERSAIRALRSVAERWPRSLWLFSANGEMCVMKKGHDGERILTGAPGSGMSSEAVVAKIEIENDGGDW